MQGTEKPEETAQLEGVAIGVAVLIEWVVKNTQNWGYQETVFS